MTSAATDAATRPYFAREHYFGLRADQCFFFAQGALPAFDAAGKVLLETPSRVCVAPDGNGGVYGALAASGALADMERRGVAYVSQYCVDNALVKVGDPEFVGFAAAERADVACKVVRRVDAGERSASSRSGAAGRASSSTRSSTPPTPRASTAPARSSSATRTPASTASPSRSSRARRKRSSTRCRSTSRARPSPTTTARASRRRRRRTASSSSASSSTRSHARGSVLEGDRAADFAPVKNAPGNADSPDTARALVSAAHGAEAGLSQPNFRTL
ncbi:UTP-glucose-1-phosphate uridylyltransferase [Aureococcus anophagefferens]|nr:UTP-glucose-1-phosphate uridylyltransferase [Aureococcus anophagefferens]